MEDHASLDDAGYDNHVHSLYRVGIKPARFINATGRINIGGHRGDERGFCGVAWE